MLSSVSVFGQQELNYHGLRSVANVDKTNPALVSDQKLVISLPSVYANFFHTAGAVDDVIINESGNRSVLDLDRLILLADDNNTLYTNIELETFSLRFRTGPWAFGVGHAVKSNTYFAYPRELPELFWNGNAQFIGSRVEFGPIQQSSAYNELWGSAAFTIKGLTIGGRAKYLSGIGNVSTERNQASLFTSDDVYQLELSTNYLINTSSFSDRILFDESSGSFGIEYGSEDIWSFEKLFGKNQGFAFDLGVNYQVSERLSFAASIIDVGEIEWNEEVTNYLSNGDFTYDGLDFSNLISDESISFEGTLDTLEEIFDFQETSNTYRTRLIPKMYLSGQYELNDRWTLGGVYYQEWLDNDVTNMAVSVSARHQINDLISVGASYAWRNNTYDNIGLNAVAKFGPVQVFAATDRVVSLFQPTKSEQVNGRVGVNLCFGKNSEK